MNWENQFSVESKDVKKAAISVSKPSYTLASGFKRVRFEHRQRLFRLLFKLMRQHNWADASGVECMLLRATCKNRSPEENLLKYTATMELLKHVETEQVDFAKFKRIYEIWMQKDGSTKHCPGFVCFEDKFAVQIKFIAFCLTEGNTREAHQAALCLMQEREFGRDSSSYMVVGLTFYQLWYSTIPAELQLGDFKGYSSPIFPKTSDTSFDYQCNNSCETNADIFGESHNNHQCGSNTSIMNYTETPNVTNIDSVSQEVNTQKVNDVRGFYAIHSEHSGDENISSSNHGENLLYASFFSGNKWEPWLLPLSLKYLRENFEHFISLHREMFNDYYYNAVKYLRDALHSNPPALDALLPFIQLLILKGSVKEALDELAKFCLLPSWVLPSRLRARILENFHGDNPKLLCDAFEETLKKDPTCLYSLARLISIHEDGNYSTLSLLEMIALHLDASHPEHSIWKRFAMCLLGLSQCEEDRLSTYCGETKDEHGEGTYIYTKHIPSVFTQGKLGREWRNRCKWWMARHFSKHALTSEIASGNWQLLAYKAASAVHLYGRKFRYVIDAEKCLENANQGEELNVFLETHIQNSVGAYPDAFA